MTTRALHMRQSGAPVLQAFDGAVMLLDIRLVLDRHGWWRASVEGRRVPGRWRTRVSALSALADMMRKSPLGDVEGT